MRISTQAANLSALTNMMRAQREVFEANQQVATGMKAPDLKGYGYSAESIFAGKSAIARTESLVASNTRLASRLEVQDLAMERISGAMRDLREAMTVSDASFVMAEADEAFKTVRDALNTQYNGVYIFGGTRTDTPPFTGETLDDLLNAADLSDLFHNSGRRESFRIEDQANVEAGALADDIGLSIMAVFRDLAAFDAGPGGPFDGGEDTAQRAFLTGAIQDAIAAFDHVNLRQAENGALQRRVDKAITAGQERIDLYTKMVAGEEEVDMAKAVSRLTQAETALQISAYTFSTLSSVSLLPFLR
jgi:flagellar hook-associated protein 3 FlgL